MKKAILISLPIILLTACNTTNFSATRADGTKVQIVNRRFMWATEAYNATLTTNGASLSASKSTVDSAAIGAAVAGAVDATVKALGK